MARADLFSDKPLPTTASSRRSAAAEWLSLRAYTLSGDTAKTKSLDQQFVSLWPNADADSMFIQLGR